MRTFSGPKTIYVLLLVVVKYFASTSDCSSTGYSAVLIYTIRTVSFCTNQQCETAYTPFLLYNETEYSENVNLVTNDQP